MSDRSKKMLALARANQQLSARFKIAPKRKTSQDLNADEIYKDPDYEPPSSDNKKSKYYIYPLYLNFTRNVDIYMVSE